MSASDSPAATSTSWRSGNEPPSAGVRTSVRFWKAFMYAVTVSAHSVTNTSFVSGVTGYGAKCAQFATSAPMTWFTVSEALP